MRHALTGLAVIALGVLTPMTSLHAETKHRPAAVTITPRYLTAGTLVSPGEYRGIVPEADARFISTARDYSGIQAPWQPDPWYLPRTAIPVDFGPLASKAPYER